jgi:hypothetical protein
MKIADLQKALKTVEELCLLYDTQVLSLRERAKVFNMYDPARANIDNSIEGSLEMAARLRHVESVLADELRRRRGGSRRKRTDQGQPHSRPGPS